MPQPLDTILTSVARIARLGGSVVRAKRYAPTREQPEAQLASGPRVLVKAEHTHLDRLGQQIDDLGRNINGHMDRHPDLKDEAELLHSIPGIGQTTVAQVLAYAGDGGRVAHATALEEFIGVTPRQRLSGAPSLAVR